jgi:hypothetical protein
MVGGNAHGPGRGSVVGNTGTELGGVKWRLWRRWRALEARRRVRGPHEGRGGGCGRCRVRWLVGRVECGQGKGHDPGPEGGFDLRWCGKGVDMIRDRAGRRW